LLCCLLLTLALPLVRVSVRDEISISAWLPPLQFINRLRDHLCSLNWIRGLSSFICCLPCGCKLRS
jgi:hypothetical protein